MVYTTSPFEPKRRHPSLRQTSPWTQRHTPWIQRQTPPGPRGRHLLDPKADIPLDPEADPPTKRQAPPLVETSTEAGGTHPTRMLSCCKFYSKSHEKVRHKLKNYTFLANKLFLFISSASRKSPFYSGGYFEKIYHHKRWVPNLL